MFLFLFSEKKKRLSEVLEKYEQQNNNLAQDLSKKSPLLESKSHILSLIVNSFLTCKDILVLRKTCTVFQNLLQRSHTNMVNVCYYNGDSKQLTETTVIWNDLKYFMQQSYYSVFDRMEIFNIQKNKYAVLTRLPEEKIIVWNNNSTNYKLLHQAKVWVNQQNSYTSNNLEPLEINNKSGNAWALITNEGNVTTGGHICDGGKSVQFQLKNVKMIFPTAHAFAALFFDGSVVAWGHRLYGGKIPDDIQLQLQNDVKMIFSNDYAFTALKNDGSVVSWGLYGGHIPFNIQPQLEKNVKIIISTKKAFAALLNDGRVFAWGDGLYGGKIPDDIQLQLQNVKMIFSTNCAFAALLNDGSVLAWGDPNFGDYGGQIPRYIKPHLKNVKIIFSTNRAFAALLNDGNVLAWGNPKYGGQIPDNIFFELQPAEIIIPTEQKFTAVCKNGEIVTWPKIFNLNQ